MTLTGIPAVIASSTSLPVTSDDFRIFNNNLSVTLMAAFGTTSKISTSKSNATPNGILETRESCVLLFLEAGISMNLLSPSQAPNKPS